MKLYLPCLLALFALPLAAQQASIFERLQAKNLSRVFLDTPSPRGEHYVYLDDANLNSGVGLNPEIRVQPGTRGVTTVVHTFTRARLCSAEGDFSIGNIRLLNAHLAQRGIQLRTIFELNQPVEIEVRDRVPSNE
jgi:hypothetical protein